MKIRIGPGVISLSMGLCYFLLTAFSFFQSFSASNVYFKFWTISIHIPATITILSYCILAKVKPVWSYRLIAVLFSLSALLWITIFATSFEP